MNNLVRNECSSLDNAIEQAYEYAKKTNFKCNWYTDYEFRWSGFLFKSDMNYFSCKMYCLIEVNNVNTLAYKIANSIFTHPEYINYQLKDKLDMLEFYE